MTPVAAEVTNILSLGIVVLDVFAVFLFVLLTTPLKYTKRGARLAEFFGDNALLFSFAISFVSILASIYYSNFVGFAPCELCWFQRILLYPQAVMFLIALIKKDEGVRIYSLVLSIIGACISIYHTSLQFGGAALIPCTLNGVSCEHVYFVDYGYVTIPTMALTAFVLIILFMLFRKKQRVA